MVLAPSVAGLFKWRQFEPAMILLAVGWYLRFSLSYRDVEELLAERGLLVDHVTVWRWVQSYALEIQRRLRPTNNSWRMDSDLHPGQRRVALPLSGGGLFRCDNRLPSSAKQDAAAAERFLAKALGRQEHPGKQTLNL
jgi:IS6 family transposase